jgi:hypothetical protein
MIFAANWARYVAYVAEWAANYSGRVDPSVIAIPAVHRSTWAFLILWTFDINTVSTIPTFVRVAASFRI